jgi:hypothetical protein
MPGLKRLFFRQLKFSGSNPARGFIEPAWKG